MTEFLVLKTSDPAKRSSIYFETLEDLLEWVKENGEVIISNSSRGAGCQPLVFLLEVYDDYRE